MNRQKGNVINGVVGGRYYICECIGNGGFSDVYKVKDLHTGEIYAMKNYVTSNPADEKRLLEGMENELNVLKHCSHPVLPKIYNIIKEKDTFFLVMEYVEGINLKTYVETGETLSKKMIFSIMSQVCSGLYYLHSLEPPIVYRDLKPSNIILKKNGGIKLIDFGIAKRYSRDVAADEFAVGSVGVAAPEQFGNKKGISIYNTDIRTDIYGIGTTMFYLRTGKKYAPNKKSFKIQGKLKKIIKKCTMVNPEKRYQSCIDVLYHMKTLHNK